MRRRIQCMEIGIQMGKRRLKRQLSLVQVVMLGTAGAISAEIFVLTGHAAAMVGPALVLALVLGGLLSYSVALNYCELATTYPETGGAMTYVREAYGANLRSFLVGSMDCLSSTFYSALSAVGFAYSLRVFIPGLPIVATAFAVVAVFVVLNMLGVSNVGNVQIVLGGLLLLVFAVYVLLGMTRPGGFSWETFNSAGGFFIYQGVWRNLSRLLATVALLYTSYVGFEVIADDAEEVSNPDRTIPAGILLSLTLCILIYSAVAMVTVGTVPWRELATSDTALSDAVQRFAPSWGLAMMVLGGILATVTSLNTAMLSATREAFTLSRDGQWPRVMSRLSRFRTPTVTILVIGAITCLIAALGSVDFLSYISSSGYLFVLFWASLAMIRLRKLHPDVRRPFKVPLFPLTAYLAAASCLLIIAFAEWRALLFGAAVIALCTIFYFLRRPVATAVGNRSKALEEARDRILIPVANPKTAMSLVHLATILAQAAEDTSVCVLTVVQVSTQLRRDLANRLVARLSRHQQHLLQQVDDEARSRNVPLYTKLASASSIPEGVLGQLDGSIKLVLMGWPGPLEGETLARNVVKVVLQSARAHVAVLLDRGLQEVRRILVPVGGGPHSRLAIRLACEIADQEHAEVVALRCFCETPDVEDLEDQMLALREIVEDELGSVPPQMATRLSHAGSVAAGILEEAARQPYDLIVVGASEEWADADHLFGTVDDKIAQQAPTSVLMVKRHESAMISWIRRQTKRQDSNGDLTPKSDKNK